MKKKHIFTVLEGQINEKRTISNCGECQNSCQSACKTSCTVANQQCLQQTKTTHEEKPTKKQTIKL